MAGGFSGSWQGDGKKTVRYRNNILLLPLEGGHILQVLFERKENAVRHGSFRVDSGTQHGWAPACRGPTGLAMSAGSQLPGTI